VTFLLDTNAVIRILNGDPGFERRVGRYRSEEIGVPSIVMYELYFGAFKGRLIASTIESIDALKFQTVDLNSEDAKAAGEIRAILNAAGTPIGPYDILIAGQALARDLTLVTHNTREFARVSGLRVEDWEV
jgi:tRNA(fMet)-specific endonuclease VapC